MAAQTQQIETIAKQIRDLKELETQDLSKPRRFWLKTRRWALMLQHEFVRDEIGVRAESLSYLMLFSMLPLLAGLFFIFSIFTRFGFVSEALGGLVDRFLATIPEEHRGFVMDYAVQFKDTYLANLTQKSGSLGIFAILILAWVGLSAFLNIDRTLNLIWKAESQRPWLEQVRNFLFVSVAAPLVLVAAVSIPFVLRQIPATAYVLDHVPGMATLLNGAIPIALLLLTFFLLYRYVPVRKVRWAAALGGACFTAVLLQLVNLGMNLYFRIGTQTAYGKAAVVPLLAFWIYVTWLVIILGGEISYLIQQGDELTETSGDAPTLPEVEGTLVVLARLQAAFAQGHPPLRFETLRESGRLSSDSLRRALRFLVARGLIVESARGARGGDPRYVLARDLAGVPADEWLREYLGAARGLDAGGAWNRNLEAWFASFKETSLAELARPSKG